MCNKLAIQRSLICLLPPKTNGYRNENGGRGNPSPTTKKPKPRSAAVCSQTPKPSPVGKVPRNEADEVLEFCTVKTADTSSVLPCGNPPSPRGKAYKKAKTSRLRTKFAVFSKPVGRWQCLCNKLAIQHSLICLLPSFSSRKSFVFLGSPRTSTPTIKNVKIVKFVRRDFRCSCDL